MKKTISNVWRVLSEAWRWRKSFFLLYCVSGIIAAIFPYLPSYLSKMVIDGISNQIQFERMIIIVSILIISICVLAFLKTIINNSLWWKTFYFRNIFLEKILNVSTLVDYELLEQPKVLDVQQRAINASSGFSGIEGILSSVKNMIISIISISISITFISVLSPISSIIIFVLSVINFLFISHTKKFEKNNISDPLSDANRRVDYFNDVSCDKRYAKDIRLFNVSGWLLNKLTFWNKTAHDYVNKSQNVWTKTNIISIIINIIQQGIVYASIIYQVIRGTTSISDFAFCVSCVTILISNIDSFLNVFADISYHSMRISDIRDFIGLHNGKTSSQNSEIEFKNNDIGFSDVSFKYPNQNSFALEKINLSIKNGERIGIVGLNGAGKTTLIKLLCGLYKNFSGDITIGNVNIKDINSEQHLKKFSTVFQDVQILALSIAQNVSFKTVAKTDEDAVHSSLKKAGLNNKIDTYQKGIWTEYSNILDADGIELSGGENQKLALGRAIYKSGDIFILDEPTAALDPLAESELYSDFSKVCGDKTVIYITHRLSSVQFCDRVVVFDNGRIVESGTHKELIKNNGLYATMFNTQAKYYEDGDSNI